jgi:hypothetical protein
MSGRTEREAERASDETGDIVSGIARIGAPILVLFLLVSRIASGHWQSVASLALILAAVIGLHFFLFAGENDAADEKVESTQ